MSLLIISSISKSFGPHFLFCDISLSINAGEHFALIGENGSGKTTLLQILLGSLLPDSGQVQRTPHLTVGLLPQEVRLFNPSITASEYMSDHSLLELERRLEVLQNDLSDPKKLAEWGEIHEEFERKGGYRRIPLEEILNGLKIQTELNQPMARLSSGQRVRVALAKALLKNPDLLLLDEPTNHLDQDMLAWLKKILESRKGATVMISHDRKFLNETCNRLIELKDGHLTCYGGRYDFYLQEQERLMESRLKAYEAQEEERTVLKQKIRALSFSKAKPNAPSDRNFMAYDHRGEQHQKSVQRTLNDLKDRLNEIEDHPLPHPKPKGITGLKFTPTPLSSTRAIEFENCCKSFNDIRLFSNFSKVVNKGDRILITGPNGCGKTTLLRCVAGLIEADSGIIRRSASVKLAYLDQEVDLPPMDQTPLDYFGRRYNLTEESMRRELHKAALGGFELVQKPFYTLSVGQKKRLMLLSLILEKPNVLLLDEPTNHLDLLTLEAFEKALLCFEGAILAVSHDQTFIKKIATDIWKLKEG